MGLAGLSHFRGCISGTEGLSPFVGGLRHGNPVLECESLLTRGRGCAQGCLGPERKDTLTQMSAISRNQLALGWGLEGGVSQDQAQTPEVKTSPNTKKQKGTVNTHTSPFLSLSLLLGNR